MARAPAGEERRGDERLIAVAVGVRMKRQSRWQKHREVLVVGRLVDAFDEEICKLNHAAWTFT